MTGNDMALKETGTSEGFSIDTDGFKLVVKFEGEEELENAFESGEIVGLILKKDDEEFEVVDVVYSGMDFHRNYGDFNEDLKDMPLTPLFRNLVIILTVLTLVGFVSAMAVIAVA